MRIFGGLFLCRKKKYSKPFLDVDQQIALFAARGLEIDVPLESAVSYLSTVNYYRFTGYSIPFQIDRETFKKDTKFSDIQAVYSFDRALRTIVFSAAEAVELTFRTILAREFARKYGPLGYLDLANFPHSQHHAECLKRLEKEFERSNALCAAHFKANYDKPPLWALVEVASFGTLVRFFKILERYDQNIVSSVYSMRGDILASYMQHVSVLRNMCAHHARLYDQRFYSFKPLKEWKPLNVQDTRAFFYHCALLYRLMSPTDSACFDRNVWKKELCAFLDKMPVSPACDPHRCTAVPPSPINSPLWI